MVVILDDGDVDVDDVAALERLVVRNAVTHDVVDRGADRFGETVITQRRRGTGQHFGRVLLADVVQRIGADAGAHMLADHAEQLRG